MDTIFTVRHEQIGALASQEAVEFFRSLLWAEARRLGIPLNKINISLWTNVADGGIDASVAESEAALLTTSGLINPGLNGYQIKTGTAFEPWQPAVIKNELFGRGKHPNKKNLGASIKACLDNNGVYVLVCFGKEINEIQHVQAINALTDNFKTCGYQNPRVEVWGQSHIIGCTQIFPSLVLDLQGRSQFPFQTHKSWSQQDDMNHDLKVGTAQETLIQGIQTELRRNDRAVHVRVWGEPGVGKTRLVLEATSAEDVLPLVVYCDAADKFRDSYLMNEITKEDNAFAVILVIDECDADSRSYIWNKFKHLGSRLKLISIYNEYDDTTGNIVYFDVPALADEQISSIIEGYGLTKEQAYSRVTLCSGSPRMAHLIGSNLKNNPDDILKPPDTVNIWQHYIVGSDNAQEYEIPQRKLVLQYVALFKRFGFTHIVVKEAQAIAEMVAKANPQITWQQFQQIITKLKARKILQGDITLYITPKAFHVYLWIEWWNTFGSGFDFMEFSHNFPDSLREGFYEMFKYAAESGAASRIVDQLLGEHGPFQNDDYLKTKLGADFFLALTEANPESALKCLQKTVGSWTKEERFQTKDSRQNIVWALERIAVWKTLFRDAARLLLALGEAENETVYSNNASHTFAALFSPGYGGLAPTEASPEERFPVLREALNSNSKEKRLLGISACSNALQTMHFSRRVGPEYQGLRKVADLWIPKSREEVIDSYRRIWQLLYSKLDSLEQDEQYRAIAIISDSTRGLIQAPELVPMIIADVAALAKKDYMDSGKVFETIDNILYYDKKGLPHETAQQLEQLRESLIGTDFPSLLKRYVGMDLAADRFGQNEKNDGKVENPIKDLVRQVLSNSDLLKPELSWLVTQKAKNGYRFAYELGQSDEALSLLPMLLEAQRHVANNENASYYLLSGYLRALFERDSDRWESLLDELADDKLLARWVALFTWGSGLSDRAALRVLNLARKGALKALDFNVFSYGSVIHRLSEDVVKQWIEFLLTTPEDYAASVALDLHHVYYGQKESKHQLPRILTLNLLTHPSLFTALSQGRRNQMDDFHWREIGKAFIELYPEDSLALADTILEHFSEEGTVVEGFSPHSHEIIDLITQKHPEEIWKRIAEYLGPPIDGRAYHLKQWLRGASFFGDDQVGTLQIFTPELVWKWVNEDINERGWYLATFVPKVLFRQEGKVCWARELLVRYGDREDVQGNLRANFNTEGWSGSESLHYEQKKKSLLEFREGEENENVRRWIDDYVAQLDKEIEYAKIAEERREF